MKRRGNGLAIAAMILGIVGVVTSWILVGILPAIASLCLGVIALLNKKKKSFSIAGIACSGVAIVIGCLMFGLILNTPSKETEKSKESEFVTEAEQTVSENGTTFESEEAVEDVQPELESTVQEEIVTHDNIDPEYVFSMSDVREYSHDPYCVINRGRPAFKEEDINTEVFETYSELDELGRCGVAFANICPELMPTEERGEIGQIKPSGWHTVKYDILEDLFLYNRCHLIAYMLAGENENEKNLITGTTYLNREGMLPFEEKVYDYVVATENHVLYRVTPIFEGDNLVASGVLMEAYSVEDSGGGVCFNVFVHNVQPGIEIDYATGESRLIETATEETPAQENVAESEKENIAEATTANTEEEHDYVLNTNTKKFHYPHCDSVKDMKEKNKSEYHGTRSSVIAMGYEPCKRCKP